MVFHGMLKAIQATIDLGNDLITEKKLEEPSTYKEIFLILERANFLDKRLARELSSLVGFRNVLVHLYWKVNLKKVYRILKTKDRILEQFKRRIMTK